MRVLIADGGTGGHIFPAIAVADELKKRKEVEAILFTGTPAGLESGIIPRHNYELKMIRVGGLIGKSMFTRLKTLAQLPLAYLQSRRIVKEFRPSVVIGFGAYASGPVLVAASHAKTPVLLVEPNAVPGFTNRIALRFASHVAVAYEDTENHFAGKAVVTGTPVRSLKTVPVEKTQFTIGIYCGSQGSKAINDTVIASLNELSKRKDQIHLIHQTGRNDFERVKREYDSKVPQFEVIPFIDQVEEFYSRCDLLICRAGAITLAEITALGKASILVPLPTSTHNHQEQNARRLADAGAARMILQKDFSSGRFVKEIDDLRTDLSSLAEMSAASRKLGRPDAAKKVADLALSLAEARKAGVA